MSSPCVPMGYLVSRYPAISHTFILREIAHLRTLGFTNLHNLSGGIDRWTSEVDPKLPRY